MVLGRILKGGSMGAQQITRGDDTKVGNKPLFTGGIMSVASCAIQEDNCPVSQRYVMYYYTSNFFLRVVQTRRAEISFKTSKIFGK